MGEGAPKRASRHGARLFLAIFTLSIVILGTLIVILVMAIWNKNLQARSDGDAVIELQQEER